MLNFPYPRELTRSHWQNHGAANHPTLPDDLLGRLDHLERTHDEIDSRFDPLPDRFEWFADYGEWALIVPRRLPPLVRLADDVLHQLRALDAHPRIHQAAAAALTYCHDLDDIKYHWVDLEFRATEKIKSFTSYITTEKRRCHGFYAFLLRPPHHINAKTFKNFLHLYGGYHSLVSFVYLTGNRFFLQEVARIFRARTKEPWLQPFSDLAVLNRHNFLPVIRDWAATHHPHAPRATDEDVLAAELRRWQGGAGFVRAFNLGIDQLLALLASMA